MSYLGNPNSNLKDDNDPSVFENLSSFLTELLEGAMEMGV